MSHTYPLNPNDVVKRKYYDLIQNLPLFVPDAQSATFLSELLDKYPVTPYLTSREALVRWVIFLHNKVNTALGKEEKSVLDAVEEYHKRYDTPTVVLSRQYGLSKDVWTGILISGLFMAALWQIFR